MDVLAVAEEAKGEQPEGSVQQVLAVCLRSSLTAAFLLEVDSISRDADNSAPPDRPPSRSVLSPAR